MVAVAEYLYRRGNTYYFLIKIPVDLKPHFGNRSHLVKALKTSLLPEAKIAVESVRAKVKSSFLLLRSGVLREEQLVQIISDLTGKCKHHPPEPEKRLSEVIRMYLDEKTPNLKKRTVRDYKTIFARNVAIIGNREINALTREDAVRLRSTLIAEGVSERTCNTHLVHLSSMLRWATRVNLCANNCAEGLLLAISKRQDRERKRFNLQDLQTIFATIPLKDTDESNVWIPLIALYSGMRKEEICQLERADIRQEEGVWIFDINNKGEKTTKTEAGLRLVPIHSKLIELGFMDFCNQRAEGRKTGNLWGFIKWRESWGKTWGGQFNSWFAQNIQKEKGKVFHSFRHTVIDELKQIGESKEVVSELVGHVVKDITFGRYGKSYSVQILRNTIEKLSYNIDLTRLERHIAEVTAHQSAPYI